MGTDHVTGRCLERVQVLGPKNHDFCQSIYFMDPYGHRLEITVRTEKPDTCQRLEADAVPELDKWNELKRRKYGKTPEKLPAAVPAMPDHAESKIVPA